MGWKGPKYKKFDTRAEAEAFVRTYGNANTNPAIAPLEISDDEDEVLEVEEVAPPPAKKARIATATGVGRVPVVYTDGSSLGNGKVGASAGVGVYFGDDDPRYIPAHPTFIEIRKNANH